MLTRVYLNIAGFTIKVEFQDEEYRYFKDVFLEIFKRKYSNFIISKPKNIFYQILFEDPKMFFGINKIDKSGKENHYFLEYIIDSKKRVVYTSYSISDRNFEILLKKILGQYLLPENNGFFMHGSAASYNNKILLFLGKSGAGKSTIVQLLQGLTETRADDKFITRLVRNKFYFFQTPFCEKNWIFTHSYKPFLIEKIFFLKKANDVQTLKMNSEEKNFGYLLNQLIIGDSNVSHNKLPIKLLHKFCSIHQFYLFEFSLNRVRIKEQMIRILNNSNE